MDSNWCEFVKTRVQLVKYTCISLLNWPQDELILDCSVYTQKVKGMGYMNTGGVQRKGIPLSHFPSLPQWNRWHFAKDLTCTLLLITVPKGCGQEKAWGTSEGIQLKEAPPFPTPPLWAGGTFRKYLTVLVIFLQRQIPALPQLGLLSSVLSMNLLHCHTSAK